MHGRHPGTGPDEDRPEGQPPPPPDDAGESAREHQERILDEALAGTFPASDPVAPPTGEDEEPSGGQSAGS